MLVKEVCLGEMTGQPAEIASAIVPPKPSPKVVEI